MRLLIVLGFLLTSSLLVQADEFQEGVHYKSVQPAQPTQSGSNIEVVEVFNYACSHCANFQPYIESWHQSKSDDINFSRIPVVFSRSWEPYARAYWISESLGVLDQSHGALFDAIHKQRKALGSDESLADFYTHFGVSKESYLKAAKSFAVQTKLNRGNTSAQRYGVTGTPSIVVNGRYITSASMAGSMERLIQVTDFLIEKERAK